MSHHFETPAVVFDAEIYPNFAMIGIMDIDTNEMRQFSSQPGIGEDFEAARAWYAEARRNSLFLGWNSGNYDNLILRAILIDQVDDAAALFELSTKTISTRSYKPVLTSITGELAIDILAIWGGAQSKTGSLKEIGVRLDYPVLQELPYPPDTVLDHAQMVEVAAYNQHDLRITKAAAMVSQAKIRARIALAVEFGDTTLLNQHDAGLAVTVLAVKMFGRLHKPIWPTATTWRCHGASFARGFQYRCAVLEALRQRIADWEMDFTLNISVGADGEQVKEIIGGKYSDGFAINNVGYTIGQGGLHSIDKPGLWTADERYRILDFDVSSFYPALIINHRFCPAHLPVKAFIAAFVGLRDRRLAAKRSGEKALADGLKIAVNSIFGKTKSAYCWLNDPRVNVAVTITGQLTLLMFVDLLADVDGVEVVSANTDGLTIRVLREHADLVIAAMHEQAGMLNLELDMTEYKSIARRDINNYVAVGLDGQIKGKGAYTHDAGNLAKKAVNRVVIDAVQRFLVSGIPTADTIAACDDIREFVDYFKATKPYRIADDRGEEYGSIARWYIGTGGVHLDKMTIADGKRTQLVSAGAVVINNLPTQMPADLDRAAYVAMADKLVAAILDPPEPVSWTIPLAELSAAQQERQRHNLVTTVADQERVAGFDLAVAERLYAESYRGNRYSSAKSLAVRIWCAGRGELTHGDLLALMRRLDAADGYFQGSRRRTLESMVEWVATQVSPWPLPRTTEEQVARAMTWAAEKVEPLKRRKKGLAHHSVLDSDFVSGPALRKYQAGRDEYALACAVCAAAVKHGLPQPADRLLAIMDDVKRYISEVN